MQTIAWILICVLLTCLQQLEARRQNRQQGHSGDSSAPACLNENGNPVDWYIAYKFPDLSAQRGPFNTGYAYAFITSDRLKSANQHNGSSDSYWTVSSLLISDKQSLIMRTLAPAFKGKPHGNPNSIFYNDQPPKQERNDTSSGNTSRAHAKGVILMDDISGRSVWLTHSTPQFPPARGHRLEFLDNARSFGQTFMCISFDVRRSGSQIADHLVNMFPLVYDSLLSDRIYSIAPEFKKLKLEEDSGRRGNRHGQRNTDKLAQTITTQKGQDLYLFSKSANFGQDIYSDWIENELKSSLFVASWRKGSGTPLNSSCPRSSFHVNNVQDFKVDSNQQRVTWTHLQDHSKWAISEEASLGFVCISDINRMQSQFRRGGGAVCMKCPGCWTVFSKTILDIESCPVRRGSLA